MWYQIFGFEMALPSHTPFYDSHCAAAQGAQASFIILVSEMKLCCLLSSTKFPFTAVEFLTRLPHWLEMRHRQNPASHMPLVKENHSSQLGRDLKSHPTFPILQGTGCWLCTTKLQDPFLFAKFYFHFLRHVPSSSTANKLPMYQFGS